MQHVYQPGHSYLAVPPAILWCQLVAGQQRETALHVGLSSIQDELATTRVSLSGKCSGTSHPPCMEVRTPLHTSATRGLWTGVVTVAAFLP